MLVFMRAVVLRSVVGSFRGHLTNAVGMLPHADSAQAQSAPQCYVNLGLQPSVGRECALVGSAVARYLAGMPSPAVHAGRGRLLTAVELPHHVSS